LRGGRSRRDSNALKLSRIRGAHGVTATPTQGKKTEKDQQKQRSKEEFHVCLPKKLQFVGGNVCLPGLQPAAPYSSPNTPKGVPAPDCLAIHCLPSVVCHPLFAIQRHGSKEE
jgi:hypothetical protein